MTRREFLALLSTVAGGGAHLVAAEDAHGSETTRSVSTSSSAPSARGLLKKSQVVEVRSERVLVGRMIHERLLKEMLEQALRHVTGREREADAWHALLSDQDVIALKFNSSGAMGMATTEPLARLLVASLGRAGWAPEKIVLIETGRLLTAQLRTQPRREGWRTEITPFGSGFDELAAVLDQVTAIINVPFLKANRIAGMSGCLKNLSHALIKHPSRFHENTEINPKNGILKPGRACAPYIGDVVACAPIRGKLRLHLVNALRTLREPMFEPSGSAVESYSALLAGTDPVAIDMIGLEILNEQRLRGKLQPLAAPDKPLLQHVAASEAGLGVWHPDSIDHLIVRH